MTVTVKKIDLWRADVPNQPGVLAETIGPLAASGASLDVVMAYRHPDDETWATVEVYPVATKKARMAAAAGGLRSAGIPAIIVTGDDRPGLGHAIARALADAGINIRFLVSHVLGRRYSCVVGFREEPDAKHAATLIRKVAARRLAA